MSTQSAPDHWLLVQSILDDILELDEIERQRRLSELCGEDRELRLTVERYLRFEQQAEDFLERPLVDLIAGRGEISREGEQLGSYCLQEPVADGGMGTVYRALRNDGVFNRPVAVKVLRRGFDTGAIVRGFRRERQILASLNHGSIVGLLDGGVTEDGLPYLVMEDVEGTRLDDFCDQGGLTIDQRLRLFETLCNAVQAAHGKLIVHCDLKPANILVTADFDLKLLDFGIARILEPEDRDATSTLQLGLGTPPYASPEQHRGEPVSTATDVYALGCLLYRLLALKPPPRADRRSPEAAPLKPSQDVDDHAVRGEALPRYRRRLRGDLDCIVQKATALAPSSRYSSAADLGDDVRRVLEHRPVEARPEAPLYVLGRFVRRHRLAVTLAAMVVVSVLGGLVGLAWQLEATTEQRDRAVALQDLFLETFEVIDDGRSESAPDAVRSVLDQMDLGLRGMDPESQIPLLDRLGRILYNNGFLAQARDLQLRALVLQRQSENVDFEQVAARLNNLALVELALGHGDRARELLYEAIDTSQRHPTSSDAGLVDQINSLAMTEQGKEPEKAEALFRLALEGQERVHGRRSTEVATALNNLGQVLMRQGRPAEARPLLEEGYELQAALLGVDNQRTLANLSNLVLVWDSLGFHEQAIHGARDLLVRRLQGSGERSLQAAKARNVLGFVLLRNDPEPSRLQEADSQLRMAIETLEATPGQSQKFLAAFRRNLLAVQIALGKTEEAQRIAERLRPQVQDLWGEDHWRLADLTSLDGALRLVQGDRKAAEPLLRHGVDGLTAYLEEASPYVVDARRRLKALGEG